MDTAYFLVYRDAVGEWRFRFVCHERIERLRSSEGYTAKANAVKAVGSVRRNACERERFHVERNSRGNFYFTLVARNGSTLATSRVLPDEVQLEADRLVFCEQMADADLVVDTDPPATTDARSD